MKTFHILNGDATKSLFTQSGLTGDICVWREALAGGPVQAEIGNDSFWRLRSEYIIASYTGYFQKGPDPKDYETYTIKELTLIENARQYDELILWFEYDLFCQINLIALISWLKHLEFNNTQISLVCIDHFPGHSHFRGLGELSPQDFPQLLRQKIRLSMEDIQFGHKAWLAYADSDPGKIKDLLQEQFPVAFPFLKEALVNHLKRFPSALNGLNHLQLKMLHLIENGEHNKKKIVGEMLHGDFLYGFGDLQYFEMLYQLGKLYNDHQSQLSLNSEGKKVISGEEHFLAVEKSDFPLGGANGRKYYWNDAEETLIESNY